MTLCQKDMVGGEKSAREIYPCPYCTIGPYKGRIGRRNLKKHVEDYHPEKLKEFMMKPVEDYEMAKKKDESKPGSKPKTSEADTVIFPDKTEQPQDQPQQKTFEEPPTEPPKQAPQVGLTPVGQQPQNLGQTPLNQQPQNQPPQQPSLNQQPQNQPPLNMGQPPLNVGQIEKDTVEPVTEFGMRPTYQVEEPENWLQTFLRSYKFKEMFVRIQVEQVKMTNELPYAGTLMQDMQTMDSGVTNRPTITYIIQNYERQVKQYLQKYEELMNTMTARRGGYPMQGGQGGGYRDTYPSSNRDTYPSCDMSGRRGIPIGREQQPQQPQRATPSYYENDRVVRLEDMIRQRDEEARRKMEAEYNNMKMKIDQGLTRQEDPQLLALKQQLDQQAAETKRLTAELAAQEKNILLDRIQRVEQNVPGAEQIKAYIENSIQAHDESSLDRRIKDAINASQGVSKIDVDMKKIDNDYDIAQKKLEVESKKGDVLGETLKDVAGLFGEGLGRGMAGGGQPGQPADAGQPQNPGQAPVACPYCKTPLMLPPGVQFGICPKCSNKMEIGVDGTPRPFAEQHPQQQQNIPQQPQQPQQNIPINPQQSIPPLESDVVDGRTINPLQKKPKADRLGVCPICGQPVYDDNVGKTENGKPYHKECC